MGLVRRIRMRRNEWNYLRGIAAEVKGLIVHCAVEPAAGLANFGKLAVQLHERILDQILGDIAIGDEPHRVIQQGRLKGSEQLFNRFGRLRARFGWLAHRHALLHDRPASLPRAAGFSAPAVAGLKGMTHESAAS